jgi:hypothetical protein
MDQHDFHHWPYNTHPVTRDGPLALLDHRLDGLGDLWSGGGDFGDLLFVSRVQTSLDAPLPRSATSTGNAGSMV